MIDRTPNPRENLSTAHDRVLEAERNFKQAKAARDLEERESWKLKARALAREARAASQGFFKAKRGFAEAEAELKRLDQERRRIEVDLAALTDDFRMLDIPLAEEEEAFAHEREQLENQLVAIREAARDAQERKGQAWNREIEWGGKYTSLAHAYRNTLAMARGDKPGKIEGGVYPVS